MSSRTPKECVALAVDESADQEDRADAIHELKMANECDELAELASHDDVGHELRQQALRALGTPQCDSMLRRLVEGDSLDRTLQQEAENLLSGMENA